VGGSRPKFHGYAGIVAAVEAGATNTIALLARTSAIKPVSGNMIAPD